jgi:hypothetical protein
MCKDSSKILDSGRVGSNYGGMGISHLLVNDMFDIEEDAEDQFEQNNM